MMFRFELVCAKGCSYRFEYRSLSILLIDFRCPTCDAPAELQLPEIAPTDQEARP